MWKTKSMFSITKIGKRIKSEEEQNLCSKHLVTIYKKIHKRKKEALLQGVAQSAGNHVS
jgi:hypothetical protein